MKRFIAILFAICCLCTDTTAQETIYPGDLAPRENRESELIRAIQLYYREIYNADSIYSERIGIQAARQIAMEALRKYPNQVNDILFTCGEYESPLFLAMCCNDYELVRLLLDSGAIPCAYRGCDENILTAAEKVVTEKLKQPFKQEIRNMVYLAQCKLQTLRACILAEAEAKMKNQESKESK